MNGALHISIDFQTNEKLILESKKSIFFFSVSILVNQDSISISLTFLNVEIYLLKLIWATEKRTRDNPEVKEM